MSQSDGFLAWRDHVREHPDLDVARLMKRTCPHLTEEEAACYGAPFPDARSKAGVRRFPEIVPVAADMEGADTSRRAAEFFRRRWTAPSLMFVGMRGPVLGRPVMQRLRAAIRGCPESIEFLEAGHFVQEWGEDVALRVFGCSRGLGPWNREGRWRRRAQALPRKDLSG